MSYAEDLRKAWNMLWSPSRESKVNMDVGKALKFYYKIGVLGMIVYFVIGAALIAAGITASSYVPLMQGSAFSAYSSYVSFGLLVFSGLVYFLVLIPISIAINSLLYQLVGRYLLRSWAGDYRKTFTAVTFSYMPLILFFWLMLVPFARILIAIFAFWQIIVLIVALAEQQKTSRTNSFVAILATVILSMIFAMLVVAFLVPSLLPFGLNSTAQAPIVPYGGAQITRVP
ncbi:MAG: hypothetical protein ACP5T3_00240 [Candidatus Micrarchaeia archaeon]